MRPHYILSRMTPGSPKISISKKYYTSLAQAMTTLMHLCELEEKFSALIENYFELERTLLQEALRTLVFTDHDDVSVQAPKLLASRRLINLLTSVRLYLDSLPQHAKAIFADDPAKLKRVKDAPSTAYDKSLSYRMMESLRNYAQHQSLPVHNWITHSSWNRNIDPSWHEFYVEPAVDVEMLSQSPKFKKDVLTELAKKPREHALKPHIRLYIELLSEIHEVFRDAAKEQRDRSQKLLADANARFAKKFRNESRVGVAALPVDAQGSCAGRPVYLAPPVTKYLPYLQRRIRKMINLSRRRVIY